MRFFKLTWWKIGIAIFFFILLYIFQVNCSGLALSDLTLPNISGGHSYTSHTYYPCGFFLYEVGNAVLLDYWNPLIIVIISYLLSCIVVTIVEKMKKKKTFTAKLKK